MSIALKAKVHNGRIEADAPTSLPEGADVLIVPVADDGLDDDERARLHAALDEAEAEIARGEGSSAEDVLAEARSMINRR